MASDRPNQTLADYVAIAISPALIMGLVGSLVFFLVEVCYPEKGEYKERLQWWILLPYVVGVVLVGRISVTQGIAGRAKLYGAVLAGLTWIGMQILFFYCIDPGPVAAFAPLINLLLVGVVWWSAHRLTVDCTDVNEDMEVNAEGLLQATGLEKPAPGSGPIAPRLAGDSRSESPTLTPEKKEGRSPGFMVEWWERWQRYREERTKKRVLGGWVIYFSLAALPLFGLGEALIPVDQPERRQAAFWLMSLYVGCGLGLLLTTCFLGVRRYLRQRRLQMPAAMTSVWLTSGGVLVVALLVIGALLPRPRPEYSFVSFGGAGSEQQQASDFAAQGGNSGKDQGNRIGDQPKDKAGQPGDNKDSQANGKDKGEPSQGKDKGDAAGQKDKDGGGQKSDKDDGGKGSEKDKSSSEKDKGDASNRPKGNDAPDPAKSSGGQKNQPQPQKDSPPPSKNAAQQNPSKPNQQSQSQANSHPASSWDWGAIMGVAATVLKWVVFGLLIVVVVWFLLREGLKFLANFTGWAKDLLNFLRKFWANLFGGRATRDGEGAEAETAPSQARPVLPFAAYTNPFRDGKAERRSPKELVQYTFDALQAWARERNVERRPDETPLEFARRLGDEFPALEEEVRRLTLLYARALYDYGALPGASLEVMRRFWRRLETAAEQPMSA